MMDNMKKIIKWFVIILSKTMQEASLKLLTKLFLASLIFFVLSPKQVKADFKDYGPYDQIWNFSLSDNEWGFKYVTIDKNKQGHVFAMVNDKILREEFNLFDLTVKDNNWGFYFNKGKIGEKD